MGKLDDINHAYITAMSKMTDEVNYFDRWAVRQKSADKKAFLTDLTTPLENILTESAPAANEGQNGNVPLSQDEKSMVHWYLFCLYSVGAYIGRSQYDVGVGAPNAAWPCDAQANSHFEQAVQLFNPVAIYFNATNARPCKQSPVYAIRSWGPFGTPQKNKRLYLVNDAR